MTRYSRDPLLPRLLGLPRFPSPTRSGGSFRGYTYRVLVTSVPFAAEFVTRMYGERPDSENRIKELKEELSLDTFCLQLFDATAAAFEPAVSATTC